MATKAELEKQRDEIQAKIDALHAELMPINEVLDEIKEKEKKDAIDALGEKHNVILYVGRHFIVTQSIADYAKARKFGGGYYPSWLVGQKAIITHINPHDDNYQIRADCDTGYTYRQGIGLNDEQRNEQIKLMSLNTPFPIELIAEALLNGNS